MRLKSRPTAQWALVSWLFSLLTLETLDSVAMFAGGLAAALMEEAATWLVHGGALAFVLAADTYFLLSRTFVTFSSTLLSFMRAHVVSLAFGLVAGAVVIDSGLKFDMRLFAPDFGTPLLRLLSSDFVMSPMYFLALVMLVMFWAILYNDSYDLLDDENSLTLSPLSLLRQSILFMAGKSSRGGHGRGGGRDGAQPGGNVVVIDALPPPPPSRPRTRSRGGDDGCMHKEVDIAPDGEDDNDHEY